MTDISKILHFLQIVEKFKTIERFTKVSSWRQESVADHTRRVVLMIMTISQKIDFGIDILKAIKIAMIHDLPETIVWDYQNQDADNPELYKKIKEQKNIEEKNAMIEITNHLPKDIWSELYNLWLEYENQTSREWLFVKAIDKIECINQFVDSNQDVLDKPYILWVYGNEQIKKFPELIDTMRETKTKLKKRFLQKWYKREEEFEV